MLFRFRAFVRRLTQHRSTRLTSEGVQFLLFTLAVGIAAINTGNNLFYLLLAMMLSIILMSGIVAEYCLRRLEFHRHLPDLLFAQTPAAATLVIKNGNAQFPSFSLKLFDVIEARDIDRRLTVRQLLPGTSQLLSYPLMAQRRGQLKLDGVRGTTSFPFGLFVKSAYYPLEGIVVVSPRVTPINNEVIRNLVAAGQEHHIARRGHGNDLYNLRLYHSGDDSRNIHWVTTAKTSQLIVRETEAEDQQRATIHLSLFAPADQDALFEDAVAFTASLATQLADRGYHLRLVLGRVCSPFGSGAAHLGALLKLLALCERRSPDSRQAMSDDELDQTECDDSVTILVRPWDGEAKTHTIRIPSIVFDTASIAGAAHVV